MAKIKSRLGALPEHYEKLGLKKEEIALWEDGTIRTNLIGLAHLIPYSPLSFFTFKTFRYLLVIFKYPQTQISPQYQINEGRFTPYAATGIRSDYRGKKKPSL
jgi:hypothetical protein